MSMNREGRIPRTIAQSSLSRPSSSPISSCLPSNKNKTADKDENDDDGDVKHLQSTRMSSNSKTKIASQDLSLRTRLKVRNIVVSLLYFSTKHFLVNVELNLS